MKVLENLVSFDWDEGNKNKNKNLALHQVTDQECEEIFFDSDKKIYKDVLHSDEEERFLVVGKTKKLRLLFVVYTKRGEKVRVISARDLNRREKHLYE
jgi:uncharacterized DUF497 family protein